MNVLPLIAPIITHPFMIYGVVFGLFLWALLSGFSLYKGTSTLTAALDSATREIEKSPDAEKFAEGFGEVDAKFLQDPVLGLRWREFVDSLMILKGTSNPIRATANPSKWFDLGLMRVPKIAVDLRFHAALPNLLVGAGLLFTFIGLAVALSAAGGIVSDAVEQRNASLKNLLDAASFKFVTSLVGLFLSISYSIYQKRRLGRVDAALDRFLSALEVRVPVITAAAVQQEANQILERQATYTETLATELSVAMQQAFDQAFDRRLGDHIGPLRQTLERLADKMESGNEDALKQLLDGFLSRLQGGAGDRMHDVSTSLATLGSRLEDLQSGLNDAAVRMSVAAEAMATRMGEGAEAALTRITDQMTALADTLRTMADQTRVAGDDAGKQLGSRIEAAARGFEEAAGRVAEALSRSAAESEARMGQSAEDSAKRLGAQVEVLAEHLRELAENSRAVGNDALTQLADRVSASASSFEAMAAAVSDGLGRAAADTGTAFSKSADEAVQRIAVATEGMRTELMSFVEELRGSAMDVGKELRAGGSESGETLKMAVDTAAGSITEALNNVANKLTMAGEEAGGALKQGGEAAAGRLNDAGNTFSGKTEGMSRQIAALVSASDAIVLRTTEFGNAAARATQPLATTSSELRAVSETTQKLVEQLKSASDSLGRGLDQMAGVSNRIDNAQSTSARLAESLMKATDRFAGVDEDLANVVAELQAGLQGFTQEVTRCANETDKNLATAVTQLHQLIKELQFTIEDAALAKSGTH